VRRRGGAVSPPPGCPTAAAGPQTRSARAACPAAPPPPPTACGRRGHLLRHLAECSALAMAAQASRRGQAVRRREAETRACCPGALVTSGPRTACRFVQSPHAACGAAALLGAASIGRQQRRAGRTAAAPPRPAAGAQSRAPRRAARCAALRRTPARCSPPPCARAATSAARAPLAHPEPASSLLWRGCRSGASRRLLMTPFNQLDTAAYMGHA